MKATLTTILLLFLATTIKAEYRPLDLYEMILGAEKIVFGELVELNSKTFTLKVEQNFTGQETELVIQRFENWPCAQRWKDYKKGERLFLFLRRYKGKLYEMSGGNEGELPIQNEFVYINRLSLDPPPPPGPDGQPAKFSKADFIASRKHIVHESNYYGHKIELESFASSVIQIRNCFEVEYGKYHQIKKAIIKCNENDLLKELEADKIFRWTYKNLKRIGISKSDKG